MPGLGNELLFGTRFGSLKRKAVDAMCRIIPIYKVLINFLCRDSSKFGGVLKNLKTSSLSTICNKKKERAAIILSKGMTQLNIKVIQKIEMIRAYLYSIG